MTAATARAHRPRLWTRDFVVSCLANICMFFNAHLFLATTAGYAAVRFGAGDAVGGAAASLFILGALGARVFAGPALERFGPKPLVYAAFALFVVFPPLYLPATSIGLLITERVLHGMAFGLGSTAVATLTVSRIPHLRIGEGTGYYASSTVIGVALGPLLGLWLADGFGFQAVVWAAVATSAVGLVCALLVRTPGTAQHDAGTSPTAGPPKPTGWHRLIQREAVPIALIGGLFTIGYATIVTFLSAYAEQRGLGAAASFFFLAYAVTVLATRPFTGRLLDVRGFNVVMVPGFVLFAAGLLLLSRADALPLLLVAAVLVGLGQGNLLSATQTLAVVSSPRHRLAMATSTFFLGIDAGMGLGPILSGIVVAAIGPSATYALLSVFMLLLLGVYWLGIGRKPGVGQRAAG